MLMNLRDATLSDVEKIIDAVAEPTMTDAGIF